MQKIVFDSGSDRHTEHWFNQKIMVEAEKVVEDIWLHVQRREVHHHAESQSLRQPKGPMQSVSPWLTPPKLLSSSFTFLRQ